MAPVSSAEQAYLERTHEELCTALTSLRNNVALARRHLDRDEPPETRVTVIAHLSEVEVAVDRLERLAHHIRDWHAGLATK